MTTRHAMHRYTRARRRGLRAPAGPAGPHSTGFDPDRGVDDSPVGDCVDDDDRAGGAVTLTHLTRYIAGQTTDPAGSVPRSRSADRTVTITRWDATTVTLYPAADCRYDGLGALDG